MELRQPNIFMVFMKQIWPYVNRGLNTVVYGLLKFLKDNIKRAFEEIKGGGY